MKQLRFLQSIGGDKQRENRFAESIGLWGFSLYRTISDNKRVTDFTFFLLRFQVHITASFCTNCEQIFRLHYPQICCDERNDCVINFPNERNFPSKRLLSPIYHLDVIDVLMIWSDCNFMFWSPLITAMVSRIHVSNWRRDSTHHTSIEA